MQISVLLVLSLLSLCRAQFFHSLDFTGLSPPPPPSNHRALGGFQSQQPVGHRAVIMNAEAESHLPEQLKNPFYKNPRIAHALAKESWFIKGEQRVTQREAEKIPRDRVYKILKQAGFI